MSRLTLFQAIRWFTDPFWATLKMTEFLYKKSNMLLACRARTYATTGITHCLQSCFMNSRYATAVFVSMRGFSPLAAFCCNDASGSASIEFPWQRLPRELDGHTRGLVRRSVRTKTVGLFLVARVASATDASIAITVLRGQRR